MVVRLSIVLTLEGTPAFWIAVLLDKMKRYWALVRTLNPSLDAVWLAPAHQKV
jgi:hypothetical protein